MLRKGTEGVRAKHFRWTVHQGLVGAMALQLKPEQEEGAGKAFQEDGRTGLLEESKEQEACVSGWW